MANQQDVNPWILDTVMASAYTSRVKIRDIYWSDEVTLGDRLVILDAAGKTIIDTKCDEPYDIQRFGPIGWVNGIQLTVLDSGKVTIAI